MSDPDRNRRRALEFLDAFATYDPARFLPLMTEDPTWRVFHSERRGRDAIAALAGIAAKLYPNGNEREIQAIVSEGDRVVVQSILRAVTNKGVDYENYYVMVMELRDGLVDTVWEYLDLVYAQARFHTTGV